MSNSNQGVKTIKCPFDPSHVMPYERFLNHLEKCQFPDKKSYRKCKFNPYHVIYKDLIQQHQHKCPDSKKYEVEDDDWGVSDSPPQEKVCAMKGQKSEVSYSTSFSSSRMSDNTYLSSSTNQKKKGKCENKSKYQTKSKVVKENSMFMAQDLDAFNPTK